MINEHQSKIIYICIGNAGTGKSTFVKSLGGDVPSSELISSGDSLTTKARFYELDRDPVVLLVDTPGFRDSRSFDHKLEFSDSEHMREILNDLLRKQASHFNGVYWFANDPRTTDELRDQARFIDALVNPEIQNHAVDRSLGWKHVTVLLRGNAVDGMAVRSVVQTVTGSLAVATSLHMKIVGLAVDGKDPGYCDLKIQGTSVQNSKTRDILELRPSIRSQVLENWFRAKDPIQWRNIEDECLDCLQQGDRRAFGRCHGPISRIHREGKRHSGLQFLVHGPRDSKEKRNSALKKTAVAFGAAGAATGTVLTGAATIMAPNPGTLVLCGTLLHATMTSLALTAGAAATTAVTANFNRTPVDPRGVLQKVSVGDPSLKKEEVTELLDTLKELTTVRGMCSTCGSMASQEACSYIWTCCKTVVRKTSVNSNICDPQVDGCKGVCVSCHLWLYDEKNKTVPGCPNKCTGCLAAQDEPNFAHNGCGDYKHRFK